MCAAMLFASCGTTDSSEDTQAATSSKTGVIRSSERQKLVENIESDKKTYMKQTTATTESSGLSVLQ